MSRRIILKNTKKQVYSGNDYFNEEYADPIYSKEEYRQLEQLANSKGIDLLAEFESINQNSNKQTTFSNS